MGLAHRDEVLAEIAEATDGTFVFPAEMLSAGGPAVESPAADSTLPAVSGLSPSRFELPAGRHEV
jgi:hypothetical protein